MNLMSNRIHELIENTIVLLLQLLQVYCMRRIISLELDEKLCEDLQRAVKAGFGRSRSEIIRKALITYLTENETEIDLKLIT